MTVEATEPRSLLRRLYDWCLAAAHKPRAMWLMIRIGWHHPAKLLIYPIRNNVDAEGRQLVNWVCDIETPQYQARDWNRRGRLEDFLPAMLVKRLICS